MKRVQTKLTMKATADLQEQVNKELQIPDPDTEEAKAILNEDSQGNDRSGSDTSNKQGG
jgi:hypothetical protein